MRSLLCALPLLLTAAGCDKLAPAEPGDDTLAADLADLADDEVTDATVAPGSGPPTVPIAEPRVWTQAVEATLGDDGTSDAIAVAFPAGQRFVAVRVSPIAADDEALASLCYRIESVALLDRGDQLVGEPADQDPALSVCSDCVQTVSSASHEALFVFSNRVEPFDQADTLGFRVVARDCALGIQASRARSPSMPAAVRVEVAWEPAPSAPDALALGVRLGWTRGTSLAATSLVDPRDDVWFGEVWRVASERFAAAGVELVLEAWAPLQEAEGTVVFGRDRAAPVLEVVEQLRAQLASGRRDHRFVPIALAACVEASDPLRASTFPKGLATRIPGGLSERAVPALVLLTAGDCAGPQTPPPPGTLLDAERAGLVLAHEIGHHLGLHHSDSAAGAPLADPRGDLMDADVLSLDAERAWFSAAQAVVLRRHPDVVVVEPPRP